MYNLTSRKHRIPFLISLLIGLTFAAAAPPTFAHAPAGSPLRLRLRIDSNTLRPNQTTKIYAEFLDRDYNQVPSDGTRVIDFAVATPGSRQTGSGAVSPERVTVRPGEWSGGTTFVSRQPGRLFITASSEGLDSSQELVIITGASASILSQLFETVAYAQPSTGIQFEHGMVRSGPANNKFPVPIWIYFSETPPPNTVVRIRTDPSAGIVYKDQRSEGAMDIVLDKGKDASERIGIFSAAAGKVTVSAYVRSDGSTASTEINFDAPKPAKIVFDSEPQSIGLNDLAFPISVQLTDEGDFPLPGGADRERRIRVSSATGSDHDFEPAIVVLAQGRPSAGSVLRLKQSPKTSQIKLLATDEQDSSIKTGQKLIRIDIPIPISAAWLLSMAILGGAIGGVARQLYKSGGLDRIMPHWTGSCWNLGLTGKIIASVVSGLFLYWTIKLGLARVPFDLGTRTAAFFLGGIGGFAGLVVLDRLVGWCFKLLRWRSPSRRKRSVAAQLASPAAATSAPSLKNA